MLIKGAPTVYSALKRVLIPPSLRSIESLVLGWGPLRRFTAFRYLSNCSELWNQWEHTCISPYLTCVAAETHVKFGRESMDTAGKVFSSYRHNGHYVKLWISITEPLPAGALITPTSRLLPQTTLNEISFIFGAWIVNWIHISIITLPCHHFYRFS